jgi:hypothetical protein
LAINTQFHVIGNVLVTTASGFDEGLNEVIDYNYKILEEAIRHNCTGVLCDERNLKYRLSLFETYQLGQYMTENIRFIKHIAIISNNSHEEILSFWENVTNNRGVHARVFYNTEEAINWLSLYNH